ncbi:MAG: DUF86 domain-containing protein [Saprospiraceae bacterium]|nr:DUF86 domain-containing protein [Saprospiraceae bacterium]
MDNVVIAKAATIERCIRRVHEEYSGSLEELETNFTKQDSIILNLERMIQACIDIGAHVIKVKELGHVSSYRNIFSVLAKESLLEEELSISLQKMVGFRNIAVHEYQALDMAIVQSIIDYNLDEIEAFKRAMLVV